VTDDWKSGTFDPFAPLTDLSKWVGAESVAWMPDGWGKDFLGYWVYDLVKIVLLLLVTSFVLNVLRRWVGVKWLRRSLGRDDWVGMCCGAALGVITPVCSCSVTPLYASQLHGGAAKRPAACFLFAAPAVNEFAIVLVWFALGWQWAVVYTAFGLLASILTGLFAHRLGLEPCPWCGPPAHDAFRDGSRFGWSAWKSAVFDALVLLDRLKWALVIGAGLAAALVKFNLTPVQLLTDYGHHPLAPLLAAVIGLPLDVNAAAAGPILIPLAKLGLPIGTLVSLMMAATVASFPEAAVLRQMIGWRGVLKLGLWYLTYTAGLGLVLNVISSMIV
jgi:hypothetical protein